MEPELRKDLKLVAISLGCAVLLLAIIMVAVAVIGARADIEERDLNEASFAPRDG